MNSYCQLAKKAVESYIKESRIIEPPHDLPKEFFERRSGIFVTLKENNQLRGCIGTFLPTRENIAKEIILCAISAATEDYRFGPVQKEELPYLSYTIYILSEPKPVRDIKDLDPKKFGIIVKTQDEPFKAGILLPDLEGVNTTEQQIEICCQKGGINSASEKIEIYCFTTQKYT
jgi:AmmeMemoRadiSam system protein A